MATLLQAALAVSAAVALPRRTRWARMVLLVLAALSLGSLYTTVQAHNWSALVLDLALGSTLGLLQDDATRAHFRLERRRRKTAQS